MYNTDIDERAISSRSHLVLVPLGNELYEWWGIPIHLRRPSFPGREKHETGASPCSERTGVKLAYNLEPAATTALLSREKARAWP